MERWRTADFRSSLLVCSAQAAPLPWNKTWKEKEAGGGAAGGIIWQTSVWFLTTTEALRLSVIRSDTTERPGPPQHKAPNQWSCGKTDGKPSSIIIITRSSAPTPPLLWLDQQYGTTGRYRLPETNDPNKQNQISKQKHFLSRSGGKPSRKNLGGLVCLPSEGCWGSAESCLLF